MTVFELAAAGVGSILVPYPHAVDDHQTANAEYLAGRGAALVRQQDELSAEWLADTISRLTRQRDTLVNMAMAARNLAKPEAANEVADRCMQHGGLT
jgi:UDP-N-acetylglucosamine--N-acetylmuramyl-(pentapeptide) pyrophosphoryl-undecaprenol N-acetylglucosamine transferase